MRTSERQHLRENEVAVALGALQTFYAEHQRPVLLGLGALAIVVAAVGGVWAWGGRSVSAARASLAEAMVIAEAPVQPAAPPATPGTDAPPVAATQPAGTYASEHAKLDAALPKFLATADQYPSTEAGLTARYHAATALVELGRYDEALAQYDTVAAGGSRLLATMARLGKAEAALRAGKYDEAIAGFKSLADQPDETVPVDAALMQLARAYQVAGRTDEAKQTLTTIVEQHADSPFAAEARQQLDPDS